MKRVLMTACMIASGPDASLSASLSNVCIGFLPLSFITIVVHSVVMINISLGGVLPVIPSLRSRAGSERSEGSGSTDGEILRCAQDDRQDTSQARSREVLSPNV